MRLSLRSPGKRLFTLELVGSPLFYPQPMKDERDLRRRLVRARILQPREEFSCPESNGSRGEGGPKSPYLESGAAA